MKKAQPKVGKAKKPSLEFLFPGKASVASPKEPPRTIGSLGETWLCGSFI